MAERRAQLLPAAAIRRYINADGRRALNGWKNAGPTWTSRANAALVYGASSDR